MSRGIYLRTPENTKNLHPPSRKEIKWTKEQRKAISERLKGKRPKNSLTWISENHPHWKGEKVGYFALHTWVQRHKGKARECQNCGKVGKSKAIQWANKDHKYRRVLEDYISLCVQCHEDYDRKNNNKYKAFSSFSKGGS